MFARLSPCLLLIFARARRRGGVGLFGALSAMLWAQSASAAGINRDGATARAMSLGGASTAAAAQPLDALQANPAALSVLSRATFDLSAGVALVDGTFTNRANHDAHLRNRTWLGAAALALPVGPVRLALGVSPDTSTRVDWRYRDTPGGADGGTTYGVRQHASEIVVLRTALGLSWAVTPQLSFGATAALLYNRNRLEAPYIFQSQPVLRTVKTLLDLETEGYGWNAQAGVLWRPLESLHLGAAYTSAARVVGEGSARGDAGVQLNRLGLGGARADFRYDAEVTNHFPQQVSAGLAWKVRPQISLHAQVDWVDWSSAFDTLEVRLTRGNNRDLNALAGSSRLDDDVPLRWRDQWIWRAGAEWSITPRWSARAGYTYARAPVPSETLTPLTAAIGEHTVAAGLGYRFPWATVDVAYQYTLPRSVHIDRSLLAAGEYSDSEIEIDVQWVGLTTKVEF